MNKVILLTGNTSITLAADAEAQREALVKEAAGIDSIADEITMEIATDVMRKLKGCLSSVESSRTGVKAPVIDWGRKIDQMAKAFVLPVETQATRLKRLMDGYAAEQRRLADEAERKRQAELKRIEEERRAAEQAEAKRQEEARRAEEAARRAEEAKHVAFTPEDSAKAQIDFKEAARIAAERREQARQEQDRIAELNAARARAQTVVTVAAKPAGLSVRDVWKFEVVNIHAVYAFDPELVRLEINTAAVNNAIRAGAREIPGLRIWSEVETGVRK